jgi:hypothetical protein
LLVGQWLGVETYGLEVERGHPTTTVPSKACLQPGKKSINYLQEEEQREQKKTSKK